MKLQRLAVVGAMLAAVGVLGFQHAVGLSWASNFVRSSLEHWSAWRTDGLLSFRIQEVLASLPVARHPLVREGLGGIIPITNPDHPGEPVRTISSGYGFLLVKTGLIGLLLYLGMALTALRRARQQHPVGNHPTVWPGASIGAAGIVILLAFNLLHTIADIPEGAIAFSLFFGMIVTRRLAAAEG